MNDLLASLVNSLFFLNGFYCLVFTSKSVSLYAETILSFLDPANGILMATISIPRQHEPQSSLRW
jgi:hypothetical protein